MTTVHINRNHYSVGYFLPKLLRKYSGMALYVQFQLDTHEDYFNYVCVVYDDKEFINKKNEVMKILK